MTTISSLPTELLINILNKLDNVSDAAECRRVCRAWSNSAERSMIRHPISIPSQITKQLSLYNFLSHICSAYSHMITHLHFTACYYKGINIDLLRHIVAACHIDSITGDIKDTTFVNIFMHVIESTPNSLDKFKTLKLTYQETDPALNLALHCKDTIQSLELNFLEYRSGEGIDYDFMDRLDEFQCLTSLTLQAIIDDLDYLDEILDKCPHLQELMLSMGSWRNTDEEIHGDVNLLAVKKQSNLKTLKSDGFFPFFTLEYFLVKFPNLEKISIVIGLMPNKLEREENFGRISMLLQRIPQKELVCIVFRDREALIPEIISYWKDAGYTTAIEGIRFHQSTIKITL